ncbi:MAG: sigma-70 family RNA polymerase sigma factor [Planctomycetia bacterium]|nr:sigma-70 family RNA polymerase sigma factor [Planctomycetia bacterium]
MLAEFAQRHHQASFAEVVRRHGGMVLSVCRSVLGNTADADDAAQAVFLTLAQKAHRASVQSHLVGWLHRVAWYIAARGAEARATRRRHEQEAARMRPESREPAAPPVQLEMLHAALNSLPEKYRAPLILHHLEGNSLDETARLLGCSTSTVAVRLHRGRNLLRRRLQRKDRLVPAAALMGVWATPASIHLPHSFIAGTSQAAVAVVSGQGAAVSASSLTLANSALKMLSAAKMKLAIVITSITLLAGGAVATIALATRPNAPTAAARRANNTRLALPQIAGMTTRTGRISRIVQGSITILRQGGQTLTVPLNGATAVILDGHAAAMTELKNGMDAGIYFKPGQPATEIRARTTVDDPKR